MASTFGAESTTDDVLQGVDLTGKRILVTGVSAGLGVETARALAAHGATVIGAARDLAKAESATASVRAAARNGFELIALDLASLKSVRACADALNAQGKPLDVVINNAGVMACPKSFTEDGYETQFAINHLGHFLLANRLRPLMRPGARLISLSSLAHRMSDVNLEDPNFETTPYTEFGAYGRSKTANALFAVAFDHRYKESGVRAASVHPGGIRTELMRHMTPEALAMMAARASATPAAQRSGVKTVPQGAATSVWAAVVADAEAIGGKYCEDCHVADVIDDVNAHIGVQPYALNPANAAALWALSETMVGERV